MTAENGYNDLKTVDAAIQRSQIEKSNNDFLFSKSDNQKFSHYNDSKIMI